MPVQEHVQHDKSSISSMIVGVCTVTLDRAGPLSIVAELVNECLSLQR